METTGLSKFAIRLRALAESYPILLERVSDRILQGSVNIHFYRPIELKWLANQRVNPEIRCFSKKSRWIIKGWHVNIRQLHPAVIVAELRNKRKPSVYAFREGRTVRLIAVFHSTSGFAIIAEQYPRRSP